MTNTTETETIDTEAETKPDVHMLMLSLDELEKIIDARIALDRQQYPTTRAPVQTPKKQLTPLNKARAWLKGSFESYIGNGMLADALRLLRDHDCVVTPEMLPATQVEAIYRSCERACPSYDDHFPAWAWKDGVDAVVAAHRKKTAEEREAGRKRENQALEREIAADRAAAERAGARGAR